MNLHVRYIGGKKSTLIDLGCWKRSNANFAFANFPRSCSEFQSNEPSSTSLSEPSLPSDELSMNPPSPALSSKSFDCRFQIEVGMKLKTTELLYNICSVADMWYQRKKKTVLPFSALCRLCCAVNFNWNNTLRVLVYSSEHVGFKRRSSLMSENTGPSDSR